LYFIFDTLANLNFDILISHFMFTSTNHSKPTNQSTLTNRYGSPNRLSLAIDTEHRKRLVVLGAKGDSALALAQAEASSRNEKYLTQAVSEAAVSHKSVCE
jgi:hypothetical protein